MKEKNVFKKFFYDVKTHFFAFILSLVFSLLFFYYIEDIQLSKGLIITDIEFKNLDSNFIIQDINSKKVKIYFKTKKETLSLINKNIVKPYIDFTNIKLGKNILKVKVDQSLLPEKTRIYKIEPKFISLTVDRKITKFLKIKPNIINKPLEGYLIYSIYFTSDKVLVEGPKSVLINKNFITTTPINVDGLDKTVLKEVNFELGNLKIISPKKVSAIIEIKKQFELKEIKNIKIVIINKNREFNYEINVKTISAKILIPPAYKDNPELNQLQFIIDAKNFIKPGVYNIVPFLNMPQQYEILKINPDKLTITIKKSLKNNIKVKKIPDIIKSN